MTVEFRGDHEYEVTHSFLLSNHSDPTWSTLDGVKSHAKPQTHILWSQMHICMEIYMYLYYTQHKINAHTIEIKDALMSDTETMYYKLHIFVFIPPK